MIATAGLAFAMTIGPGTAHAQSMASHQKHSAPTTTAGQIVDPPTNAAGRVALDKATSKREIAARLDTAVEVQLGSGKAVVQGPSTPATTMAMFWPTFVKVNNALLRAQPNTRSAKLDVSHFGRNVTLYCWVDYTDNSKYVWFRTHPHGSKFTGWMRADLIYWGTYPRPGRCR